MKFLILLQLAGCSLLLHAQKVPTQAEIEKMKKQAAQLMKAALKNPEAQAAFKEAMQAEAATDEETGARWGTLPPKNLARLAQVSKTVVTLATLQEYVSEINKQLTQKINPDIRNAVAQLTTVQSNPLALSRAAIAAWYKNRPVQALALAAKATERQPDNPEIVNTLGALLNLCGYPHKAIPVLQTLNTQRPGNSTVLNNLGQGYLALGDLQKAEDYFLQCIAQAPIHVEANKSLGIIYQSKGQWVKAQHCFLQSLKGGYAPTAATGAKKAGLDEEAITRVFVGREPVREYFNLAKYQLPPLCEKVQDAIDLKQRHETFRKFIQNTKEKYNAIMEVENEKILQQVTQLQSAAAQGKTVSIYKSPFWQIARRMHAYWFEEYAKFMNAEVAPQGFKFYKEKDKLYTAYQDKVAKIRRSNATNECEQLNALANEYLPQFAALQRDYMDRTLTAVRGYFEKFMYWSQYMNNVGEARSRVLAFIEGYLDFLKTLSQDVVIIEPACTTQSSSSETGAAEAPPPQDCPFTIKINLIVGDITMDCEKFAIEMNAGLSFAAEKNFISKETTLAIGIGVGTSKELELPVIGVEGGAGVSEQFYVVFDGDNRPSDIGIKFESSVNIEVGGAAGPLSTEIGSINAGAGYTLGLNSGWNFNATMPGSTGNLLN